MRKPRRRESIAQASEALFDGLDGIERDSAAEIEHLRSVIRRALVALHPEAAFEASGITPFAERLERMPETFRCRERL